jgi:hypothetical protein
MAHQRRAVLPPTVGGDRLGAAHGPGGTAFVDPSEAPSAISGEGVREESQRWEGISTVRRSGYRRLCGSMWCRRAGSMVGSGRSAMGRAAELTSLGVHVQPRGWVIAVKLTPSDRHPPSGPLGPERMSPRGDDGEEVPSAMPVLHT